MPRIKRVDFFVRRFFLRIRMREDRGAILRTDIGTLAVPRCGIV
jgi:hypothetical protein